MRPNLPWAVGRRATVGAAGGGQEDGPRPWTEEGSPSTPQAVLGPGQTSGREGRRGRCGRHTGQVSEPQVTTESHLPLAQCGLTHLDHADDLFDGSPEIVHPGRNQKCWKEARRGEGQGRSSLGTGQGGDLGAGSPAREGCGGSRRVALPSAREVPHPRCVQRRHSGESERAARRLPSPTQETKTHLLGTLWDPSKPVSEL